MFVNSTSRGDPAYVRPVVDLIAILTFPGSLLRMQHCVVTLLKVVEIVSNRGLL